MPGPYSTGYLSFIILLRKLALYLLKDYKSFSGFSIMLVYEVIFHAENILSFYLAIRAIFLQSLGFRVEFRYFFLHFFFFATLHSLWGLSSLIKD